MGSLPPLFAAAGVGNQDRVAFLDMNGIPHFEVFYGASDNERAWWDNHRAYELGYRPTNKYLPPRRKGPPAATAPLAPLLDIQATGLAGWLDRLLGKI